MRLSEDEVNSYLQPFFGQYEDSFQQAWLEIIERDPQTLDEVKLIARRNKNRAIKQHLHKRYREKSLNEPIGQRGDERFTLESILASPQDQNYKEEDSRKDEFYKKVVDFLIGEYISQKEENASRKRKEMDIKAARLRLREEELKFKKDRFESWKKLMEDKGKEKEIRLRLRIQLQRERFELERSQNGLMADKMKKPFSNTDYDGCKKANDRG